VTLLIYTILFFYRGPDSVVGIRTTLWAERFGIQTFASPRDFIFSTPVKHGLGAHPASCAMGIGSFPGLKRLGRDVKLSPPFNAEIKNGYSYNLHPLCTSSDKIRGNLIFTFCYMGRWKLL